MVKTYRSTSRYLVIWNLVVIILSLGQGSGDAKDLFTVCTHQEQNPGCRHHDNTTLFCTDFIPDDPLGFEEVDVTWCSSRPNEERLDIKEDLFMNNNWTFVKSFTYIKSQNIGFHTYIAPFAFKQMTKLERIRLHVLKSQLFLNSQSFCGVDNLKSLNFSGSTYLEQHFVTQVFLLNECMPNLEELSLSGISLHHDLDFDDGFLSLILKRPIRTLDLRFLHVKKLNITTVINNCAHLEYLYLSDTMFEKVDHGLRSGRICPQLKLVDVSRAQFTFMKLFCLIRNLGDTTSALKVDGDFQFLLHTETLIWDRLCTLGRPMPLSIKSVKLSLETPSVLRQLFMRNNNIDVFDAEINWLSSSVKFLDLSNNRFGYLNPLFFSSGENFRHVNLADNRLSNMVDRSAEDFEKLFFPLAELRYLGLSRNNLTFLPKFSFLNNTKLEYLDLSQNLISSVSFSFEAFGNLTLLNLSENRIDFKDPSSVENVERYIKALGNLQTRRLDISKNPLSCYQSEDLWIIKWLLKYNQSFYNWDETKCLSENGSLVPVNSNTLVMLEEISDRPVRKRNIMIFSTVAAVLLSVMLYKLKDIAKTRQLERTEETRCELLRQIAEGHEFAVFLSFNSDDQYFVKECIYHQLNRALQTRLNINRDLVFISELHMKGGVSLKNGIRDALGRSAVLLVILSDSFCESEWCLFEFNEALNIKKPIVLMVKGEVDEDSMPEHVKLFFRTNTRIIWRREENGDYLLEMPWENVLSSILSAT